MSSGTPARRRSVLVALAALLLVVGLAAFVPRGGDDDALLPSGGGRHVQGAATTAGFGRMTPALAAEVDRVVARGRALGRDLTRSRDRGTYAAREVATFVRCADFEGQRYCLGTGWTDDSEAQVQARTLAEFRSDRGRPGRRTGDLEATAALSRAASMTVAERARAERAELTMAARSVAKVWLVRHDVEGVPLPAGFLTAHPEARTQAASAASVESATPTATPTTEITVTINPLPTPTPTASPTVKPTTPTTYDGYPESAAVLDTTQVAEQERNYWCGPTAMQMIAWGWKGKYRSQDSWASKLGTTSHGTSISSMVKITNSRTGWDQPDHAGPYIALDVQHYSFDDWQLLVMKHVVDLRSPMILHVQLLKLFFPYLDHDGSGHFQVGRGYDKRGDKPDLIGYFEPWNQQRFHPDEPFISRVQWRQSYRTYRATLAHYQHNVGI